jgi:natural product precursor
MKKLNFEKFHSSQIAVSQLNLLKGGETTAGGGIWSSGGGRDVYSSWSSDYYNSAGDRCLVNLKTVEFECIE